MRPPERGGIAGTPNESLRYARSRLAEGAGNGAVACWSVSVGVPLLCTIAPMAPSHACCIPPLESPDRAQTMIYVLASVLCSVLVSVLLKLARRLDIDVGEAIAWNYAVAGVLTAVVLHPSLAQLQLPDLPWLALLALGVLLPTIFLALAASVRHAGIVRSDAAQRLSLVLSLLAAFALFGEALDALKAAGAVLGLLALLAMVWRGERDDARPGAAGWAYPLLVFAGFGVIDILFKRVAAAGVPLGALLQLMFALALVVAFGQQLVRWRRGRRAFAMRSAGGGALLGLLNFGNILFYLHAHQALPQHPALVFASVSLGVVALGAVAGLLAFGERLSRLNLAGLLLALVAIGLLTHG
jgi:drug/metabolite transporter (DMT)-like permease